MNKKLHFSLLSGAVIFLIAVTAWVAVLVTQVYAAGGNLLNLFIDVTLNDKNQLVLMGGVNEKNFQQLQKLYNSSQVKPQEIVVTSDQGDFTSGIQMGLWIAAKNLTITVPDHCTSICANFIFVAGRNKKLGQHGMVIWRGGVYQRSIAKQIQQIADNNSVLTRLQWILGNDIKCHPEETREDCIERFNLLFSYLRFAETFYYHSLNLDANLPYYGQLPRNRRNIDPINYQGFYYTPEDMKKMGVNALHIENEIWQPESNSFYTKAFPVNAKAPPNVKTDALLGMEEFKQRLHENPLISLPPVSTLNLIDIYLMLFRAASMNNQLSHLLNRQLSEKLLPVDHPIEKIVLAECRAEECFVGIEFSPVKGAKIEQEKMRAQAWTESIGSFLTAENHKAVLMQMIVDKQNVTGGQSHSVYYWQFLLQKN